MRRAQEMHSHTPRPQKSQREQRQEPSAQKAKEEVTLPPPKEERSGNTNPTISKNPLFADKEKLLILALVLILSSEESCDPSLTLALLYLII